MLEHASGETLGVGHATNDDHGGGDHGPCYGLAEQHAGQDETEKRLEQLQLGDPRYAAKHAEAARQIGSFRARLAPSYASQPVEAVNRTRFRRPALQAIRNGNG